MGATALLLILLVAGPAFADDQRQGLLRLLPAEAAVSQHEVAGLRYTARAATLPVRDGKGDVKAEIFHVAYTLEGGAPERPLTFVFNGGPGAASAFLHLGTLGPRVIEFPDDGTIPPPPPHLVDNPHSWLGFTDLVFVDPVGTGYSRTGDASDEGRKQFWGVSQDADALAAFLSRFIATADRAGSPIYLVGESYGGFRVAVLAERLQSRTGLSPSGLVLVSPALEFPLLWAAQYQALPWALRLPSYAAAELERQGIAGEALDAQLREVEAFALSDYLVYLAAGPRAGELERSVFEQVARWTGLPTDIVERHRARISVDTFIRENRRAHGRLLSRYDATVAGPDPQPWNPRGGPDPVLDPAIAIWNMAFVRYARDELGWRTDLGYEMLNREVSGKWDFGEGGRAQAGALDDLRKAMATNPKVKVLIAHGSADLVTPYMVSKYLLAQSPPMAGAETPRLVVYGGGHMMYTRSVSRARLREDAAALYR